LDRLFRFEFLSDLLNYLGLFFLALMTLRLSVLIHLFQLNFVTLPHMGACANARSVLVPAVVPAQETNAAAKR
jgi:hypothetical protein